MADARQWPKVMRLTYGVALPLYWGCGLLGYAAYGDFAQANINLNFPENGANVASLWVQLLQEVYFMLSTNLVMVLAIEIHLGIDPARAWTPAWRGLPPWAARLLLRTLFLGSQVFVAQLLLSGEGDTLLSLQSLIGAIGMTAFTYFLPYAAYLVLAPEPLTRRRTAWCAANVVIGVVVMLAGLLRLARRFGRVVGGALRRRLPHRVRVQPELARRPVLRERAAAVGGDGGRGTFGPSVGPCVS